MLEALELFVNFVLIIKLLPSILGKVANIVYGSI